jgi:hypothetical protein
LRTSARQISIFYTSKIRAGKLTIQPANVLLLLLERNVVGDHVLELKVQATLLEVAAPEGEELGVEVLSGGTCVEALAGPVLLSGLGVGDLSVLEVRDLLNLEVTVLNDGLDQESTAAGLLNGDVDAGGEGRGKDLVLALSGLVLVVALVGESIIGELVHGVLGEVVDVGDGESDTDARE